MTRLTYKISEIIFSVLAAQSEVTFVKATESAARKYHFPNFILGTMIVARSHMVSFSDNCNCDKFVSF